MTSDRPVNYWDYIRVEELLDLQGGVDHDEGPLSNDEVLFITVHQVFELWFKLILRELRSARDLFVREHVAEQELSGAVRSLQRVATIFRMCAPHFEVMETLTTRDYLEFRDKLMGASGFQSAQLREIEILFGLDERDRISLGAQEGYMQALEAMDGTDSPAKVRVLRALADMPTLKEAIANWLYRTPIDGCGPEDPQAEARLDGFVERFLAAHAKATDRTCERALVISTQADDHQRLHERYAAEKQFVHDYLNPSPPDPHLRRVRTAMVFIETYRELPLLAWPRQVLDSLVQLEQLFVIFRQRHARMVERTIGRRMGTGGSSGVDYLDSTALAYRVFRDLWTVRTLQIPRAAAPNLERAAFYGFRVE